VDENRILFIQSTEEYSDLFTMNPDGTDVQRLTEDDLSYMDASWSPDLQLIAATGMPLLPSPQRQEWLEIHILDRSGEHQYRLTWNGRHPTWSPDGSRIAFERQGPLGYYEGIYIIDADGTNERQIDRDLYTITHIWDWSNDGQRLLVMVEQYVEGSSKPESYELYEMDLNGNLTRQITDTEDIREYDAKWSSDNNRIAYSTIGLYRNIYILNSDSANVEPITPSGDNILGWFCWSPDDYEVAFTWYGQCGSRDERREWANIYTTNDDGTRLTKITSADSTNTLNLVTDWR
jgi:Tol biopolymer transport system component